MIILLILFNIDLLFRMVISLMLKFYTFSGVVFNRHYFSGGINLLSFLCKNVLQHMIYNQSHI